MQPPLPFATVHPYHLATISVSSLLGSLRQAFSPFAPIHPHPCHVGHPSPTLYQFKSLASDEVILSTLLDFNSAAPDLSSNLYDGGSTPTPGATKPCFLYMPDPKASFSQ